MKKRILKIGALIFAILLIVGVCLFANSLVGNPISKALAKNTAEKHLEETYGDKDYELERVSFSFKDGYYHAYISSPSSVDSDFSLLINGFGKLRYDEYENVTNGWNTAHRLDGEYRKIVDTIFDSRAFPFDAHIGYGDLIFIPRENHGVPNVPEYALITDDLILDAYYNVGELGAKAGKLTVYVADSEVSAERMAQILLEIRSCFDQAGVGFYAIDCVLEYPKEANGEIMDGRVEAREFLYADIYEEGLTERVEASNQAANAYDTEWDSEK